MVHRAVAEDAREKRLQRHAQDGEASAKDCEVDLDAGPDGRLGGHP